VLFENCVVARLQRLPDFGVARGNYVPCTDVTFTAVIGAAVRHGLFNGAANTFQIVGKIAAIQVGLHSHHAAANVHTNGRRNNRTLRGNDAAHRRADAPVDVGHGCNPLKNERKLSHVQELRAGLVFERDALGPRLDGHAFVRR